MGRITSEELTMVRDSIMYPHMLTMCEKARTDSVRTGNLFAPYFAQFIERVMDLITQDLSKVRREFRGRQIKVWEGELLDGILYYEYTCRGYKDRFGIVREALRTEISFALGRYSDKVLKGGADSVDRHSP